MRHLFAALVALLFASAALAAPPQTMVIETEACASTNATQFTSEFAPMHIGIECAFDVESGQAGCRLHDSTARYIGKVALDSDGDVTLTLTHIAGTSFFVVVADLAPDDIAVVTEFTSTGEGVLCHGKVTGRGTINTKRPSPETPVQKQSPTL